MREIQEKRMEFYTKRVREIVDEFHPAVSEREDAIQSGMVGLAEAMREYRGVWCDGPFKDYSINCIRKEIGAYLKKEHNYSDHTQIRRA